MITFDAVVWGRQNYKNTLQCNATQFLTSVNHDLHLFKTAATKTEHYFMTVAFIAGLINLQLSVDLPHHFNGMLHGELGSSLAF